VTSDPQLARKQESERYRREVTENLRLKPLLDKN